ncbi:MAG: hypothetical protein Q6373_023400 [Candidatus Sigynarchaeota archaeon]
MEHVWIIRSDGIVLYHKGDELGISSDLLAGLFSAINTLASQMDESGINAMVIGQSKLSIRRAHGVLFVMLHDNRLKEKKVISRLAFIESAFFSLYPPASLAEWRGNLAHFAHFGQAIAAMP